MQTILERLISQIMAQGKSRTDATRIATAQLQKTGSLKPGTQERTAKGKKRTAMGAAGRAPDGRVGIDSTSSPCRPHGLDKLHCRLRDRLRPRKRFETRGAAMTARST